MALILREIAQQLIIIGDVPNYTRYRILAKAFYTISRNRQIIDIANTAGEKTEICRSISEYIDDMKETATKIHSFPIEPFHHELELVSIYTDYINGMASNLEKYLVEMSINIPENDNNQLFNSIYIYCVANDAYYTVDKALLDYEDVIPQPLYKEGITLIKNAYDLYERSNTSIKLILEGNVQQQDFICMVDEVNKVNELYVQVEDFVKSI